MGPWLDSVTSWLTTNPQWRPSHIVQTTRLGIPHGRDEHLMYRFVDADYAAYCTRNPLRRGQVEGQDYLVLENTALL